jgi:hypothetical protein
MPYDREDEYREGASVTPTGMPQSYGQQHQAASASVGARRPNQQVKSAIMQRPQTSGTAQGTSQAGPQAGKPPVSESILYQPPQGQAQPGAAPNGFGRSGFGGMNLDFGGLQNPMNYSGFNLERAFAGGDPNSVKDGFARTVGGLNLDLRGLEKAQVGDALRSQVIPALNAQGIQARMSPDQYDVIEVFSAERGWEPIDVVQNAGSADAAWAWQDLMGGGAPQQNPLVANSIYSQTQQSILNPQAPVQDDNNLWMLLQSLFDQEQQAAQPQMQELF